MIKSDKEMIEEALQDFQFTRAVERAIVKRVLDRFILYDVRLVSNETLSRLGYQEREDDMPIDPPDTEWAKEIDDSNITQQEFGPPPDFPNPDRPQEIWMNLRLDIEASRDRLNHAMDILVKLEDYGRAKYLSEAMVLQYSTLFALKTEYDREDSDK